MDVHALRDVVARKEPAFVAGLEALLTPGQVETIKDEMTYNKVRVDSAAAALDVPRNYLSKVMHALAKTHDNFSFGIASTIFATNLSVSSGGDFIADADFTFLRQSDCSLGEAFQYQVVEVPLLSKDNSGI